MTTACSIHEVRTPRWRVRTSLLVLSLLGGTEAYATAIYDI